MHEFCSCGAQLPPDALFCHKCGKAQRELVAVEEPEAFTPVAAPEPMAAAIPLAIVEPLPLNFHNPIAVRIAMLVALGAAFLGCTLLPLVSYLGGGMFAALFYRRRTGWTLSPRGGARMGWMTGLLVFGISTVVWTALALPAAISGRLVATILAQMKNSPMADPALLDQMKQVLQTGDGLATMIVFMFLALFIAIIGLSMAGGALGAMMGRNSQASDGAARRE